MLEARGLQNTGPEDVGLSAVSLCQWYFQRLGRPVPASIRHYARRVGFPEEDAFLRAVLREYCYVKASETGRSPGAGERSDDAPE